jgi:hypothetical protein
MPLANFYRVTLNKVAVPVHADDVQQAIAYARKDSGLSSAKVDMVQLWHGGRWFPLKREVANASIN